MAVILGLKWAVWMKASTGTIKTLFKVPLPVNAGRATAVAAATAGLDFIVANHL